MRPECLAEVQAAIGRAPTKAEADAIEAGLLRHMRELARTEPRWREMSGAQRMQAAATMASEAAIAQATKTAERKAANILAQAREASRLADRAARLASYGRKNAHHSALFERMRQVEDYVAGVRNEVLSGLVPAIQAVEPKFFGWMDDPKNVRAFVRAVMDGDDSNPAMARAAKVYLEQMEQVRLRANAAGADIGKLDYGYLPQSHDTGAIARAGQAKWVADVLPLVDRSRYLDATGAQMDQAELTELLRGAWETLATEGRNKRASGQVRGASTASRFDDRHRVLHFKDGDAYSAYQEGYGRGSALAGIYGHVGQMAKAIGLMEEWGANPTATYRLLKDLAEKGDNRQGVHESLTTLDMVWDTLTGATAQPVNEALARFFQGVRNFTAAVKLQAVMLSAITDAPLQVLVAKSAGIPVLKGGVQSLFRGFGKDAKAVAQDLALGMDEIAGEMARWHQDFLAQGWTSKLANTTMKLTLVEGWTNALRRGFALTLSGALDRARKSAWTALPEHDRRRFESAGVTEQDWRIWQAAESINGRLTKDGIRGITRERLATALGRDVSQRQADAAINSATARLLGYIDQEARTAVLSPDLQTRAMVQQGTRAGTVGGEVLRSAMLFKSFAFGIVEKHLRRIRDIPTAQGKAAYSIAMMTSLTLFGAVSVQLKDLVNGKDPRDMTDPKFWAAAFMQGGGLGIFGDILYTGMGGNTRGGQANWTSLAGPVFGNAFDALNVVRRGAGLLIADERDTREARRQFGAEALRFAKGNTPLLNLWYLRAIVDHMAVHDMQEQLSPGYLRRMERRAQREWGQEYWWRPGEKLPERAPEMAAAAGG